MSFPEEEPLEDIIIEGYELLQAKKAYAQADVVRKLASIGHQVSTATFNKVIKGKHVGTKSLKAISAGVQEIILSELGYRFAAEERTYRPISGKEAWSPETIPQSGKKELITAEGTAFRKEGRMSIQEKVAFITSAKKEVVELGVRLRSFANYFTTRSRNEFRDHIYQLLEQGVNFKLYLLHPDSQEARLYFEDRVKVQPEEKDWEYIAKSTLDQFRIIRKEIEKRGLPGKFEVFLYRHVPYNHFLIVDGVRPYGRMIVSTYLYGIRRADCPLIVVSKNEDDELFRRYRASFLKLAEGAAPCN